MLLPTQTETTINLDEIDRRILCARCGKFRGDHDGLAYTNCKDGGEWKEPE